MTDNESRPAALPGRIVRAVACGAALAAAAALTASCATAVHGAGSVTATSTLAQPRVETTGGQPAGDAAGPYALCQGRHASRVRLRRLVVTLHAAIPANVPAHSTRRWTVTSETKMRAVQHALCGLPKQPKGTYDCPLDLGISYQFRFRGAHGTLPAVTADAAGCELVTGLGKATRWAAESPRFWPELRRAIGLVRLVR